MGFTDYFDVPEFRQKVKDTTSPYTYDDADIMEAQEEVIDHLETWARTSWKLRADRIESRRSPAPLIVLGRIPVAAIAYVKIDGTALTLTDLEQNWDAGIIRWGDWSVPGEPILNRDRPGLWEVKYSFGFDYDDVPLSIRRPCIQAAQSLMDGEESRGNVPRNTLRYSTERTDITLGRRGAGQPFPWDPRASDDIRAYWQPHRPRSTVSTASSG